MAVYLVSPRVVRLRCLQSWRRAFTQTHIYAKREDGIDEQKRKIGANQHHKSLSLQRGYRLYYNLSSCHHTVCKSATSQGQTDNDEQCLSTLASSFWQQSNHYNVSCSQHFSILKNTLPDLAFNKDPEPDTPSVPQFHRKSTPPDVTVNPRAFHNCRPEYASMAIDLTQRPHPIELKETLRLLKKASLLKGNIKAFEVSELFVRLRHVPADKTLEVRNDKHFIKFLRNSVKKLPMFTNAELLEVLQSFVWLDISSTHPVLELYETELKCRASKMTLHQLLLGADVWRCIKRQVPQFLQHLYDLVHSHLGEMGPPELVQLLYIIGEGRYCPPNLIGPVQRALVRHCHQIYPEEIGIICLGLFKSQTSMPEHVMTLIIKRALTHLKEMSDYAFVNVLKLLRLNYLYHRQWLDAIAHEIPLRAPKMGVSGLMHVALFCSAYHYQNFNILMSVAERIPSLAAHCRSKDSSKLLWSFGTLQFPPDQSPSFYPSLIESMRWIKDEFRQYPQHLLSGLLGLAFVSKFPEDLLALALSPEFVELALKSTPLELSKDLLTLDGTVALELPQWTGPRLSSELREEITRLLWDYIQANMCHKPELLEAESALVEMLGGEKFVCKRMILPHTRSIDLEVHFDSTGAPIPINTAPYATTLSPVNSSHKSNQGQRRVNVGVPITEELLAQIMDTKRTPGPSTTSPQCKTLPRLEPDEGRLVNTGVRVTNDMIETLATPNSPGSAPQDAKDTVKLAIQVFRRRHHSSNSLQLLGIQAMKRRQLKLTGYKVVELSYHEWSSMLRRSRFERLTYLHCKVYGSL